jgi:hypothetical protein
MQPHPLQLELANYTWILLENKGFAGEENEKEHVELLKLQKSMYADCLLADSMPSDGEGSRMLPDFFF